MSGFDEIRDRAASHIAELDARVPSAAEGTCKHCDKPIVFKPYYLDGKRPNPPIWFHQPGSTTCSTRPKGWRGRWPLAEPKESPDA